MKEHLYNEYKIIKRAGEYDVERRIIRRNSGKKQILQFEAELKSIPEFWFLQMVFTHKNTMKIFLGHLQFE